MIDWKDMRPDIESIISQAKLAEIHKSCNAVKHLAGDTAEVGVYKGGTSLAISKQLSDKTHHMFDTFCGMPFQGQVDKHKIGEFSDISIPAIRMAFEGRKARFHIGVFPETAKDVTGQFCLVHVDGDQYQTTKDALEFFYPKMVKGGHLILDDYEFWNCPGVAKAVHEFLVDKPETLTVPTPCQALIKKL